MALEFFFQPTSLSGIVDPEDAEFSWIAFAGGSIMR